MQAACARSARRFRRQRHSLEAVQRAKLRHIVSRVVSPNGNPQPTSWEAFRDSYPVTRYPDWRERILNQRSHKEALTHSPLVRYQPTSGSSEKLKLIPYTRDFLDELDAAICPWISSLYRHHPGIKHGAHYWSVSWLPQDDFPELQGNINDDSELLGSAKRFLIGLSHAVSSDVALAANPSDSLFASLCYLVASPQLTVMSVWSPTFALQLLDMLPTHCDEIAEVLTRRSWGARQQALKSLAPPFAPQQAKLLQQYAHQPIALPSVLWPRLALMSAWDTADAAPWAKQLHQRLPKVAYEGKGLWATEGVVSIPVDDHYPLAYRSHFYEFEDLKSGNIKASWELREGDEVSPILTGGNGLLRYALDDRIVVTGFWGQVPCLQFLGRRNGVDLVGEKLSPETARQALQSVADNFGLKPASLLAVASQTPGQSRYMAVFDSVPSHGTQQSRALSDALERCLKQHFHYALARDLKQLLPAQALLVEDGWAFNKQLAMANGMIEGNIKPEALRKVPEETLLQLLNQHGKTA